MFFYQVVIVGERVGVEEELDSVALFHQRRGLLKQTACVGRIH